MPTPDLYGLGTLEIGGETTFGVVASTLKPLRIVSQLDRAGLTKEALPDEHVRTADYHVAKIIGAARGTVTTSHEIHGYASAAPSAAPARVGAANGSVTAWDLLMDALAGALGGIKVGGYVGSATIGASGTPTDTLTADPGELASFASGQAALWATGNARCPYEVGWFTSVTSSAGPGSDTAGLLQTPRYDPQGTTLWGSYTLFKKTGSNYFTAGFTDAAKAFSLKHIGADGTVLTPLGAWISGVKITITPAQKARLELTWTVAHWSETTGGSLSVQTYSYPAPQAVSQWLVRLGSGSDVIDLMTPSIEIDFGIELQSLMGGYSDSGVEGHYIVRRAPTVTMSVLRDVASEVASFLAQEAQPLQMQFGNAPGKMFACCMPASRIAEYPSAAEDAGKIISNVTFVPGYYTGDSGAAGDTNPINTDFRIAFP